MNMLIATSDVERWFALAGNDVTKATRIAVTELRGRAAAGDDDAASILDGWTHGGARQDLKSALRTQDQVFRLSGGVTLPRRGFSERRDDGNRQLVAWDVMTRAEFAAVLVEYRAQTKTRTKLLRLLERTDRAWDAHPECGTAAEAFRVAGVAAPALETVAA